jgi:hypothetical protein
MKTLFSAVIVVVVVMGLGGCASSRIYFDKGDTVVVILDEDESSYTQTKSAIQDQSGSIIVIKGR